MGKATIIEAQNANTVYEEGKSKGILGKLKGVFADYKHGTRNADRLYTEQLWDNRVFGSEDVMEALETKTLFGELDHPQGDRCETLAQNAAISITKLEKRPDEGVIYGEAEILDTPTGRIVKALADSGAKLGISSRGMGEEIYREGKNIIDPDTYDFITFDVVVTPANTKARVSLAESKHLDKLCESIKKSIRESETENQLNQLKTVLETVKVSNKDNLLQQVNTKLESFNTPKSNKLTEVNKKIAFNLLQNKLQENTSQLKETLNASNQLAEENKNLLDSNKFLTESRLRLRQNLKIKTEQLLKLQKDFEVVNNTITTLTEQLQKQNISNKQTIFKRKQIENKKLENMEQMYKEKMNKLNESKLSNEEKIKKLQEENIQLQEKLQKDSIILNESNQKNKELQDKITLLEQKQKEDSKILMEGKLLEANKVKELENKVKILTEQNNQMLEAQDRFSKLAFNPIGTVKAVAENFSTGEYTQDDIDLYNALTGK